MSDTKVLLSKITALRQRLEQAQNLAGEAGAALASVEGQAKGLGRIALLERQLAEGSQHGLMIDGSLRLAAESASNTSETRILPKQLTSRARRLLERGRDLLTSLRQLSDELEPGSAHATQEE